MVEEKDEFKDLNDFIDKMEVVYAVLLAWGFARAVEKYVWSWDYIFPLLISGFVLIRFFFAASHNLKPMAKRSKDSFFSKRLLFLWDIPLLVFHSFVYYRMCYALSDQFYFKFYELFFVLLFINIIWLISINLRKRLPWSLNWSVNNFIHLALMSFAFIYFKKNLHLLFYIAISNCLFDFFFNAPSYLGFNDKKD